METKKILFITDTYYPDSSATTNIVVRTAEFLTTLGYSVEVYPTEMTGNIFCYPREHNGVTILKLSDKSVSFDKNNEIICSINKIVDSKNYDCIFSVAEAFEVNLLVYQAIKDKNCNWFPMSYDPFAFKPHITDKKREEFIKLEEEAFKIAKKIFFLNEFRNDYINAPFKDKIVYFNLPCIREIKGDDEASPINFDNKFINCVFLGDFYLGVENTDFIFRLFDKISLPVKLYTIGKLGDFEDTVNLWKSKLKDKYICHERIDQKSAHAVMLNADVLVSMGHDSPNMCPSKIIDFIASGKPILHIEKIKDCCGTKYLENYNNKICVYQNDELTDEKIHKIERFIVESKTKERVPFKEILKKYSDFTMESLIKKIIQTIENE